MTFAPGFGPAGATASPTRRCRRPAADVVVRLPRPALGGRVRGVRPRPTWTCPARRSSLLRPGRGGQRPGRRGAGQRLGGPAPRRGRSDAGAILECWLSGQAAGRRGRRRAARRGRTLRPARRDHPGAAARTTQSYLNFPGDAGHVPVRRGRLRRLPRARPARPAGQASRSGTGCPTRPSSTRPGPSSRYRQPRRRRPGGAGLRGGDATPARLPGPGGRPGLRPRRGEHPSRGHRAS